jgi:hypothetical protein
MQIMLCREESSIIAVQAGGTRKKKSNINYSGTRVLFHQYGLCSDRFGMKATHGVVKMPCRNSI